MPNFPATTTKMRSWVGDKERPASVGDLIADNPSSVAFVRENKSTQVTTTLTAQTIRIELASTSANERTARGGNAVSSVMRLVLLGYKEHPTETDTDIQRGDRFAYGDRYFVVKTVEAAVPHFIQAICEVMDG